MENRIAMLKARISRALERIERCQTSEEYLADLQIIQVNSEELKRLVNKEVQ